MSEPVSETAVTTDPDAAFDETAYYDLLDSMTWLADLLMDENDALYDRRINDVAELQDQKMQLTRNYQRTLKTAAELPGFLESIKGEWMDSLKETMEYLAQAAQENERLLKINMDATQRVMQAVVNAAREHASGAKVYDASGGVETPGDANRVAIAFNETL